MRSTAGACGGRGRRDAPTSLLHTPRWGVGAVAPDRVRVPLSQRGDYVALMAARAGVGEGWPGPRQEEKTRFRPACFAR
jgi:hypothetical protein